MSGHRSHITRSYSYENRLTKNASKCLSKDDELAFFDSLRLRNRDAKLTELSIESEQRERDDLLQSELYDHRKVRVYFTAENEYRATFGKSDISVPRGTNANKATMEWNGFRIQPNSQLKELDYSAENLPDLLELSSHNLDSAQWSIDVLDASGKSVNVLVTLGVEGWMAEVHADASSSSKQRLEEAFMHGGVALKWRLKQ